MQLEDHMSKKLAKYKEYNFKIKRFIFLGPDYYNTTLPNKRILPTKLNSFIINFLYKHI